MLHLMADQVFNDMAIRELEHAAPGMHRYGILAPALRKTTYSKVELFTQAQAKQALRQPGVDVVVFHSLPPAWYHLLRTVPNHVRTVWIGMGFDYYSLLPDPLVLPKTRNLVPPSRRAALRAALLKAYLNVGFGPFPSLQSALRRVDYFAPVLNTEFDLVQKHFPLKAQYIDWNYGSIEDDFQPSTTVSTDEAIHVLVGNSAYETNNHVEVLDALSAHPNLGSAKIYVPLSYGRSHYRDAVVRYGRDLLGDSFHPLTDFVPIQQYNAVIASCGFVIMNHLRQQGLGNVITAMLAGAKVYLNPLNPLYTWLADRGAHLGTTDRIDLIPLTDRERATNVAVVTAHWSQVAQRDRVAAFVAQLQIG